MILVLSAVLAVANFRFAGDAGMRRFERLSDKRALVLHDHHRSGMTWYFVGAGAIACVDAAVSWWAGSLREAAVPLLALGLTALAAWWSRSARHTVLSGFAARGLEPLHHHETSRKRSRRTRQFGVLALGGYLAIYLLDLTNDDGEPRWMTVVALVGLVALIVGLIGAVWSAVWRYGDEVPDTPDRS